MKTTFEKVGRKVGLSLLVLTSLLFITPLSTANAQDIGGIVHDSLLESNIRYESQASFSLDNKAFLSDLPMTLSLGVKGAGQKNQMNFHYRYNLHGDFGFPQELTGQSKVNNLGFKAVLDQKVFGDDFSLYLKPEQVEFSSPQVQGAAMAAMMEEMFKFVSDKYHHISMQELQVVFRELANQNPFLEEVFKDVTTANYNFEENYAATLRLYRDLINSGLFKVRAVEGVSNLRRRSPLSTVYSLELADTIDEAVVEEVISIIVSFYKEYSPRIASMLEREMLSNTAEITRDINEFLPLVREADMKLHIIIENNTFVGAYFDLDLSSRGLPIKMTSEVYMTYVDTPLIQRPSEKESINLSKILKGVMVMSMPDTSSLSTFELQQDFNDFNEEIDAGNQTLGPQERRTSIQLDKDISRFDQTRNGFITEDEALFFTLEGLSNCNGDRACGLGVLRQYRKDLNPEDYSVLIREIRSSL